MKKFFRIAFVILLFLAVVALIVLYLLTNEIAVMEPKGLIGIKQRNLFVDASLIMLVVVIPAIVMSLIFAWRYRANNEKAKYHPDWGESHLAEAIWWGVPFLIIAVIGVITWKTSHELNPFRPIENGKAPLTIQVVALEWKWLFLYPEQKIATVNYIQIPENTPIRFEITADAPMNSFWIPSLGGQIYAMPAMRSELYLIADKEGTFNGYSANISGTGFAGMTFEVKATSEKEFERWVETVSHSSKQMTIEEYKNLLKPSQYNPVTLYQLSQDNLFELILQSYEPEGFKGMNLSYSDFCTKGGLCLDV